MSNPSSPNNTTKPRYKVDFNSALGRFLVIDTELIHEMIAMGVFKKHADSIAEALNNSGAYLKIQAENTALQTKLLFMNDNCISLGLHDDRMGAQEQIVKEHKESLRKAVNRCADQTTRIEQLEAALKSLHNKAYTSAYTEHKLSSVDINKLRFAVEAARKVLEPQALTLKRSEG